MGTGNLQIISRGPEDVYLTGNPQFTFFKSVYKRHSVFSVQKMEVCDSTAVDFGETIRFRIDRNGDLLKNIFLELKIKGLKQDQEGASWVGFTNSFMASLIEYVEIVINGERIDRIEGVFFDIYNELFLDQAKRIGNDDMMGKYENPAAIQFNATENIYTFYLPLPFWFCESLSQALPLIAMQHSEILIYVKLRESIEIVKSDVSLTRILDIDGNPLQIESLKLFGNYVVLDKHERKLFSTKEHTYLITQHQTNIDHISSTATIKTMSLSFKHPIKYLIWVIREKVERDTQNGNEWVNYSLTSGSNPLDTASIRLNGVNHIETSEASYYNKVVPYYQFKNYPRKFIHAYSFAEFPADWKPSGHFNFSKLDKKELVFSLNTHTTDQDVFAFTENYNLFRIKSGLAGVAFANL